VHRNFFFFFSRWVPCALVRDLTQKREVSFIECALCLQSVDHYCKRLTGTEAHSIYVLGARDQTSYELAIEAGRHPAAAVFVAQLAAMSFEN